jgi:CubicO group peptidase (beta-lactamase class C family)
LHNNFNGAVVVATDGKIDYLSGIGIADENGHQNKVDSKVASITKTFTAVLILQTRTRKIDLKATFGNYFPNYKGEAKKQGLRFTNI